MPLIRKVGQGLWEVRTRVADGTARVVFTVEGDVMVLLHAFMKKSRNTPRRELATARRRLAGLREE
jgi:phage-related protein